MRLSEELFTKRDFPTPKGGLFNGNSGYDPNSVENFLEDVAVKVEKMEKENGDLKARLKVLLEEKELRGNNSSSKQQSQEQEQDDELLEMKDQIKKKLKQIETLERSYKRMIYIAEQEADEIKEEAKQEATKLLVEAQERAETLVREAHNKFSDKEREMTALTTKAEEVKERLKNVSQFIEDAVS